MRKTVLIIAACVCCMAYNVRNSTVEGMNDKKTAITFSKDIAPILQQKCQECHHPGGIAPMSFMTYEEVRPWARSIKEKTITRTMPPFSADGPLGYFADDKRLEDEQIAMISSWVDNGAAKGNPADLPPPRVWSNDWYGGKPNLILSMRKPYEVKIDGKDDYELFALDHVFAEETWIKGIEIRPGNRKAVHHVSLYMIPDNLQPDSDGHIEGVGLFVQGGQLLLNWVPGSTARLYPEGYATRIPKGARFGIQLHYAPSTKPEKDMTSVGFYLAEGLIHKQSHMLYGGSARIEIPPGQNNYQLTDYRKFKTDVIVKGFSAHMHLRGKSFTFKLHYPDGRVETVCDIPRYNFNWQRLYRLAKPIPIPKGTVAEYSATWDNSAKNSYNPDPTQVVRFGEKTTDEMMSGTIQYELPNEDLNIWVSKGLRVHAPESASKQPSTKK